ncbi:MAG: putative nucleic acid-binding Zn-ribbon protein [Mariniblastus sp.]
MSLDYGLLRKLHRMLRQLTDISERMEKGPRKVRIVTANEASFAKGLEESKERLLVLRKASNAKQMQLGEREAKIEDFNAKLNACASNKEFQLLKDRIAADLQANSVLQDEILEQLERLDVLMAEADAAKRNYEKSKVESSKMRDEVALELNELKAEQERITHELAESETELPVDIIGEYRRLVAGKGEDTLGPTDTETCGNCNQRVITQMVSDLMMRKLVNCQRCGCILYLPEGYVTK